MGRDLSKFQIGESPNQFGVHSMSPSDIEVIHDDILEKGTLLETMSRMKFPDAEKVGNTMAQLLDVVEG
jgi:hypothetical protein